MTEKVQIHIWTYLELELFVLEFFSKFCVIFPVFDKTFSQFSQTMLMPSIQARIVLCVFMWFK